MRPGVVLLTAGVLAGAGLSAARSDRQAMPPSPVTSYRIEPLEADTLRTRYSSAQLGVLEKLNRRDLEHLIRLDDIVVPVTWTEDELAYSPLPRTWAWADGRPRVLVVDQPSQVFGAYERGQLVRWGPVSSGRRETPTPSGVFYLNWKAKSRTSTDNAQWLLKWYFNFINARGVSFHQFDLPGEPMSHACVRLLERDAMWLYDWGEQWRLSPNGREVVRLGTPVVILGTYAWDQPPPWRTLDWWSRPVALPADPLR